MKKLFASPAFAALAAPAAALAASAA
ncbi:hypothetical protein LCGC14_0501570, partial [marine sediment metagenome]